MGLRVRVTVAPGGDDQLIRLDTARPRSERQKMKELDINARTRNALLRSLRCLGERGFALLCQRWKTLQLVTMSPGRIGEIARAALVLTLSEHKMIG
jgi:hypothetical protein